MNPILCMAMSTTTQIHRKSIIEKVGKIKDIEQSYKMDLLASAVRSLKSLKIIPTDKSDTMITLIFT